VREWFGRLNRFTTRSVETIPWIRARWGVLGSALAILGLTLLSAPIDRLLDWCALHLSWVDHSGARVAILLLVALIAVLVTGASVQGEVEALRNPTQPRIPAPKPRTIRTAMPGGAGQKELSHFTACLELYNEPDSDGHDSAAATSVAGLLWVHRPDGTIAAERKEAYWGDPRSFRASSDNTYPLNRPCGSRTTDLDVNGHVQTLQVIHKQEESGECFVWSPHDAHHRIPLPDHEYAVRVRLQGRNLRRSDCDWWFRLTHEGTESEPTLRQLSKAPWEPETQAPVPFLRRLFTRGRP
jgi:hypothetical protein